MTLRPAKSARLTVRPVSSVRLKAGACCPGSSRAVTICSFVVSSSGLLPGADGPTRTRTPRAQEPKSCVSTSSTTSARGVRAPTVVATTAYHGPRLRLRPEEVLDETCSRRCLVDGPNGTSGPALDTTTCPQCGAVAEVTERAVLESTAGPVEHVRVVCLDPHWFLLPAESVTSATAAGRTGRPPP